MDEHGREDPRKPAASTPAPAPAFAVAGPVATQREAAELGHMALVYAWAMMAQQAAGSAGRKVLGLVHRGPRPPPHS